jgi:hypothetical protein
LDLIIAVVAHFHTFVAAQLGAVVECYCFPSGLDALIMACSADFKIVVVAMGAGERKTPTHSSK